MFGGEKLGEHRNVFGAVAQRGNLEFEPAQPKIQILPECPASTRSFSERFAAAMIRTLQVTVLSEPERLDLALLQETQQADLKRRRDFGNLVEEHRSAVAPRETAPADPKWRR